MSNATQTENLPAAGKIPGSAQSSVSMEELHQLEASTGWTEEDGNVLQWHRDIFLDNAEQMVDAWRSVIGSQPHLAKWFLGPDGKPDDEYKAKVKARFVQWVRDVCVRPRDQAWLDYQEEIGPVTLRRKRTSPIARIHRTAYRCDI